MNPERIKPSQLDCCSSLEVHAKSYFNTSFVSADLFLFARRVPGAVPSPALHQRPSGRDPALRCAAYQSEGPLTRHPNAQRN